MAIYEYRCGSCRRIFELNRPMSQASEPADCPDCGKEARRIVSVFSSKSGYDMGVPTKDAFRGPEGTSSSD